MDYSLTLLLPSTASPLPLLHYLTALPPSPPPSASPPFLSSSTFLLLSLCCIIFHNCEAFSRLSHPETLAHTPRHLFPRVLHLLTFTYPVGVVVLFHHRPTSHSYIYQTTLGKNKKKPPAPPRLLVHCRLMEAFPAEHMMWCCDAFSVFEWAEGGVTTTKMLTENTRIKKRLKKINYHQLTNDLWEVQTTFHRELLARQHGLQNHLSAGVLVKIRVSPSVEMKAAGILCSDIWNKAFGSQPSCL